MRNQWYFRYRYKACLLLMCVATAFGKCVQEENCKLPFCFCGNTAQSTNRPGDLNTSDIPQLVLFSFDDGVNIQNFELYNELFPPSIRNPNGCPIAMTLFVSHLWTNYEMVHSLYRRGMEIAVHSVSHRVPTTFWKTISEEDMRFEIRQQKENICILGRVRERDIHGYRNPFLVPSGDTMFKILQENNFEYDSTYNGKLSTTRVLQQWPFTLDFGLNLACDNQLCPKGRYPGLWEVPVVAMNDLDNQFICTYADSCHRQPMNRDETFQLLWKNFELNYFDSRAPLYVNMHSAWLTPYRYRIEAVQEFIRRLTEQEDVYLVTYHQSIEWMRDPTPLPAIKDFKPWQCAGQSELD